jgi:hypothetical protein
MTHHQLLLKAILFGFGITCGGVVLIAAARLRSGYTNGQKLTFEHLEGAQHTAHH